VQPSFIIAQILGPAYVVIGMGLLLNTANFQRILEDVSVSPAFAYLAGLLALIFGLVILVFHHAWNTDWTLIVTLFGWLALIKGSLLVTYPGVVLRFSQRVLARSVTFRAWAIVLLVLGLFLSVKGYALT